MELVSNGLEVFSAKSLVAVSSCPFICFPLTCRPYYSSESNAVGGVLYPSGVL